MIGSVPVLGNISTLFSRSSLAPFLGGLVWAVALLIYPEENFKYIWIPFVLDISFPFFLIYFILFQELLGNIKSKVLNFLGLLFYIVIIVVWVVTSIYAVYLVFDYAKSVL